MPVVSVSSASCWAQVCAEPCRNPALLPNVPLMLSIRRIAVGERPAASAAASMAAFMAGISSSSR